MIDNREIFLKTIKKKKINLFRKFLLKEKIYYASSGIIFFSQVTTLKNIDYIIKQMKVGTIKYFNHKD